MAMDRYRMEVVLGDGSERELVLEAFGPSHAKYRAEELLGNRYGSIHFSLCELVPRNSVLPPAIKKAGWHRLDDQTWALYLWRQRALTAVRTAPEPCDRYMIRTA